MPLYKFRIIIIIIIIIIATHRVAEILAHFSCTL